MRLGLASMLAPQRSALRRASPLLSLLLSACASTGGGATGGVLDAGAPTAGAPIEEPQLSCEAQLQRCQDSAESTADGDAAAAEDMLAACVACEGAPPAQFILLASLQEERGDVLSARKTLQSALRNWPSSAPLCWQLARLALSTGNVSEGLGAYARAVRLDPEDPTLAQAAQRARLRYGGPAVRLSGALSVRFEEAEAAISRGELPEARALLEDFLPELEPAPALKAELLYQLARLRLASGEEEPAMQAIQDALPLTPSDLLRAQLHLLESELHLSWSESEQAARAAAAAAEESPADPLPWVNLAIAQGRQGQRGPAVESLRQAFERGLERALPVERFDALLNNLPLLRDDPELLKLRQRAYALTSLVFVPVV